MDILWCTAWCIATVQINLRDKDVTILAITILGVRSAQQTFVYVILNHCVGYVAGRVIYIYAYGN